MCRIACSFTLWLILVLVPACSAQFPPGNQIPASRNSATPPNAAPPAVAAGGEIADRADAVVLAKGLVGTVTQQDRVHVYDVRIQVRSVLKGDGLAAGQELALRFTDNNPRAKLSAEPQPVQPDFGMLFLKQTADSWEPLRASPSVRPSGAFLLRLPEDLVPSTKGETLQSRIGFVIAAALEKWGTEYAAALDDTRSLAGFMSFRINAIGAQFDEAANLLHGPVSDPAPYAEVYRMLARSASPHVRLVGLIGLIRLGDPTALQAVASDFDAYASSFGARRLPIFLRGWDVSRFPATVDTLGAIALSGAGNAQLESAVAWTFGMHPLVDSLPYIAVLLESPDPNARAGAMLGFCNLTETNWRSAVLRDYVPADAREYCSNRYPILDAEREARNVTYWRNWWQATHDRLEKDFRQNASGQVLPFARVSAPTRWVDARQPRRALSVATKYEAVRMFLMGFRPNSLGDATTEEKQLGRLRNFLHLSLDPGDERTLRREVISSAAKLQEMDEAFRHESMKRRAAGQALDAAASAAQHREESSAVVSTLLMELRRRMSPEAWRQFDESMEKRANDTVKTVLPVPAPLRPVPRPTP